jgi:hypothetical protein
VSCSGSSSRPRCPCPRTVSGAVIITLANSSRTRETHPVPQGADRAVRSRDKGPAPRPLSARHHAAEAGAATNIAATGTGESGTVAPVRSRAPRISPGRCFVCCSPWPSHRWRQRPTDVPQRVDLTSAVIRSAYVRGGPARGGCPLSTPGRALVGRVRVRALAGVAGADPVASGVCGSRRTA